MIRTVLGKLQKNISPFVKKDLLKLFIVRLHLFTEVSKQIVIDIL